MQSLNLSRGFLPQEPPMERLPKGFSFSIWNELCDELPNLLREGLVRNTLAKLPLVSPQELGVLTQDRRLAECAARKIFFLGSAFVHPYFGEGTSWEKLENLGGKTIIIKTLPAALASAMHFFGQYFNRPPILSYSSYCLNNWRPRGTQGELTTENSEIIDGFLKTPDEDWFIKIHWVIEEKAIPALKAIRLMPKAVQEHNFNAIHRYLERMTFTLSQMLDTLKRMPEGCSTDYYWDQVRPFIFFFDNVVYEGVEVLGGQPQKFFGETGAQSSIIPAFDTILGIKHRPTPLIGHIRQMRDYMPVEHRAFLERLESPPSLHEFITKNNNKTAALWYNECLRLLHAFRSQHLQWAKEYIAQKDQNPYGTGGTKFLPFLEQMNNETLEHRLTVYVR